MKKFWDLILSFILPRKMLRHAKMRFMFSLMIVVLVAPVNILTSNLRSKKDAERALDFPSTITELSGISFDRTLPHISIDEGEVTGYYYENGEKKEIEGTGAHLSSDEDGVWVGHKTHADGKETIVTTVIEDRLYSREASSDKPAILSNFDLEGYLKQKPKDNTEYMLYVWCLDDVYYLFGFDQMVNGKSTKAAFNSLVFECNDKGELKYYLPASSSELAVNGYGNIDTTLWTRECGVNDTVDFTIPSEYQSLADQIVPNYRHLKNVANALYGGAVSYNNLAEGGVKYENFYSDFGTFSSQFKTSMVSLYATQIKLSSLITSFIITIIFSFLLSFITWVISKSFILNKFKQYFALLAICFAVGAIVSLIAGFFVSYLSSWFYILLFDTIFYIIVCFRINTMKPDVPDEEEAIEKEKEPIEYKKVDSDVTHVG